MIISTVVTKVVLFIEYISIIIAIILFPILIKKVFNIIPLVDRISSVNIILKEKRYFKSNKLAYIKSDYFDNNKVLKFMIFKEKSSEEK